MSKSKPTSSESRLNDLENDPACDFPFTVVCKELGLSRNKYNYLCRWQKSVQFIRDCIKGGYGASSRYKNNPPRNPVEEDEVYLRFLNRRIVKGYPANHFWLILEMRKVLEESMETEENEKERVKMG